jgi:hypothetical protein
MMMGTDKSGFGYGNHGGDESFKDNKDQVDPSRDIPDDAGKGDYEDDDDQDRAQALPEA